MPRFSSRQSKQPQEREAMKPPKQQQPKKTFNAEMGDRIKQLADARLEKERVEHNQRFKQQEDEVMAMTYGPDWRKVCHDWESEVAHKNKASDTTVYTDEFDDESYDDPRGRRAS